MISILLTAATIVIGIAMLAGLFLLLFLIVFAWFNARGYGDIEDIYYFFFRKFEQKKRNKEKS